MATEFSSPKSNDANTHDKYLRLEVDFDVDLFLTLVFYFIIVFLSSPKDMLVDFREGGKEGERERNPNVREKYCLLPLVHTPIGDQTCNPGMCPD